MLKRITVVSMLLVFAFLAAAPTLSRAVAIEEVHTGQPIMAARIATGHIAIAHIATARMATARIATVRMAIIRMATVHIVIDQ